MYLHVIMAIKYVKHLKVLSKFVAEDILYLFNIFSEIQNLAFRMNTIHEGCHDLFSLKINK